MNRNMDNPFVFEVDDHNDAFFNPRDESIYDAFGQTSVKIERKLRAIEEKMKAMEGSNSFGLDTAKMFLVSGVQISAKLKVHSSEKNKGVSCPKLMFEHTTGRWLRTIMIKATYALLPRQPKWGLIGMVHEVGEYVHPNMEGPS